MAFRPRWMSTFTWSMHRPDDRRRGAGPDLAQLVEQLDEQAGHTCWMRVAHKRGAAMIGLRWDQYLVGLHAGATGPVHRQGSRTRRCLLQM